MSDSASLITVHIVAVAFWYPVLAVLLAVILIALDRHTRRFLAAVSLFFAILQLAAAQFDPQAKYFVAKTLENLLELGWVVLLMPITLPLLASGFVSGVAAGRNTRWIDGMHVLVWVALFVLWISGY